MTKTKVKAKPNQLAFLRQQMVLYPDMGQTNSHVDPRWENLKVQLDGLGVTRILKQWKKSWKDQEKHVFVTPPSSLSSVPGLQPIMRTQTINPSTNSVARPMSNITSACTTATQPSLQASTSNDTKPTPIIFHTPLPTHLFSVPAIKAELADSKSSTSYIIEDSDDDEDDDEISLVGYSLGMASAPMNTSNLQSSNKENEQPINHANKMDTPNNEGIRRGIKRTMDKHNETMRELLVATNRLAESIENRNKSEEMFRNRLVDILNDIAANIRKLAN